MNICNDITIMNIFLIHPSYFFFISLLTLAVRHIVWSSSVNISSSMAQNTIFVILTIHPLVCCCPCCALSFLVHGWCSIYHHGCLLPSLLPSTCWCLCSSIVLCQRNFPFPSWNFGYSYSKELFFDNFDADILWAALPLGCCFLSSTDWMTVVLHRESPLETMMDSLCHWSNRLLLFLLLAYFIGIPHNVCISFNS